MPPVLLVLPIIGRRNNRPAPEVLSPIWGISIVHSLLQRPVKRGTTSFKNSMIYQANGFADTDHCISNSPYHMVSRMIIIAGHYQSYREWNVNWAGKFIVKTIRQEKGFNSSADAQRPLHPAPMFGNCRLKRPHRKVSYRRAGVAGSPIRTCILHPSAPCTCGVWLQENRLSQNLRIHNANNGIR